MSPIAVKGNSEAAAALVRFKVATASTVFADTIIPTVLAALRAEAPYRAAPPGADDHRHLRDSFSAKRNTGLGGVQVLFTSDVPQATFLLEGTRGHGSLTPGKPLHWLDADGEDVFAMYVRGISKNRFNERAWMRVGPVVLAELVDAMRGAVG